MYTTAMHQDYTCQSESWSMYGLQARTLEWWYHLKFIFTIKRVLQVVWHKLIPLCLSICPLVLIRTSYTLVWHACIATHVTWSQFDSGSLTAQKGRLIWVVAMVAATAPHFCSRLMISQTNLSPLCLLLETFWVILENKQDFPWV